LAGFYSNHLKWKKKKKKKKEEKSEDSKTGSKVSFTLSKLMFSAKFKHHAQPNTMNSNQISRQRSKTFQFFCSVLTTDFDEIHQTEP
jgi:hypothetical protein